MASTDTTGTARTGATDAPVDPASTAVTAATTAAAKGGATADRARSLHAALAVLRESIAADADSIMAGWRDRIFRDAFIGSAENLADYLAFRRLDLRGFQPGLAALGLSSLGRCEAHVRPTLDAVSAALAAIGGLDAEEHPPEETFTAGAARIEAGRDTLFGNRPDGGATRVMVTLPGEAGIDPGTVRALATAGADCLRINCAHDTREIWAGMIANIRAAEAATGRRLPIEMDIIGRKMRIAAVSFDPAKHKVRLKVGEQFVLTTALMLWHGSLPAATLSHPDLIEQLEPGHELWFDDGTLHARVVMKEGPSALLEVVASRGKGMKLKPGKGVNCPAIELGLPLLSVEDEQNLDFAMRHADMVGVSFVETPEDLRALVDAISPRLVDGRTPALVLKIETARGVANLPRLIVEAGGRFPVAVMIARGDLAVEIGLERLSEIQEEMLWLAEAAHVPVIWATQVLEEMVKTGRPTRAEVTDAAMAGRAECVMLNKGDHLVDGIGFLCRVLKRMERHQGKKTARLDALKSWADIEALAL